ncbi:MAG TPA: hypothetical protein VKZ18_04610 [Polyangia bacterium]|nr:hypothetical protein [Polyangia bacterium]
MVRTGKSGIENRDDLGDGEGFPQRSLTFEFGHLSRGGGREYEGDVAETVALKSVPQIRTFGAVLQENVAKDDVDPPGLSCGYGVVRGRHRHHTPSLFG